MGTDKDLFRFYTRNEDLKNWLQSQSNQSEFIEEILIKVRTGELQEPKEYQIKQAVELEYKQLRNQKLKLDIKLKEKELAHWNTFGTSPSPQAKHALIQSVSERGLTKQEIYNVKSRIALRWEFDRFKATCPFCRNPFDYQTENEAVADMARHFEAMHSKEALK